MSNNFVLRGQKSQHIVDGEQHRQVYTEQAVAQRFGAFWVDSLYTCDKAPPDKGVCMCMLL